MYRKFQFTCVCLALSLTHALESNSYCTENVNTGPNLPFQQSFRAEIAGKLVDEKKSVSVVQTVSHETNKSSIFWTVADRYHFAIHDFGQQWTLVGSGVKCSRVTETDPMAQLARFSAHIFTGDAEYINKTKVRGIPVDYWRRCVTWPGLANFTLDIYVTDNEVYWNMPSPRPWVPVRLVARGFKVYQGVTTPIHHVYDYVRFGDFDGDQYSSSFEPPTGVLCPGLHQDVPMVQIPTSLSFSRETSFVTEGYADDATIYYDTFDQLYRNDYLEDSVRMIEIRDFNDGVMYKIDSTTDACQALPISQTGGPRFKGRSLDINEPFAFDDYGYLVMRSTNDYFMASGNFTYEGERPVRGVTCQLYSTRVQNKDDNGWTLVSLYFSKTLMVMYNTGGLNNVMEDQLMRMITSNRQGIMSSDIYNLDPEPSPQTNPFDVSRCFNETSQISFVVTFKGGELPERDFFTFGKLARRAIAKLAEVSSVRVHWQDVSVTAGQVSFTGKLLDKTPDLVTYTKTAGKKQDSSVLPDSLKPTVFSEPDVSATACATFCSQDRSASPLPDTIAAMPLCDSFDFCSNRKTCYFYRKITDKSYRKLAQEEGCDHYQVAIKYLHRTSLEEACTKLSIGVNDGRLQIPILKDALVPNIFRTFTAVSVTDIGSFSPENVRRTTPLSDYQKIPEFEMKKPSRVARLEKEGVSLDSCAKFCTNSLTFQCLTFTYRKGTANCRLYDTKAGTDRTIPVDPGRNAYIRSYTNSFEKIPDTSLPSGDNVVFRAFDVEACAFQCLNTTEFLCQSFQYCPQAGGGTCSVSGLHIYDHKTNDVSQTSDCDHYVRNYLTYFDQTFNKITNYMVDRTVSGVSATQCARVCSRATDYDCSVFQYCETERSCQLINRSAQPFTSLSLTDKLGCSTFSRRQLTRMARQGKLKSSDGYTTGSMAGIGVGMALAGSLLCLAGLLIFSRVRRPKAEEDGPLAMEEVKKS